MSVLALDLVAALDPVAFAASLGFVADEWQASVLRSPAKRKIFLGARQIGKSQTTAMLALHRALFYPDSLVLLISPSIRQSGELARKVAGLVRQVEPSPELTEDNRLSIQLANRSRVVALPGAEATIRGFSAPDLIIEDEASRVPDELHDAIRPMLAVSNGTLILLSTPFGKRGHFYEAWEHGAGWERTKITAEQCPRISPAFLEAERASLSPLTYQSEYLCLFVDTEQQLFSSLDIDAALDDTIAPLFARSA